MIFLPKCAAPITTLTADGAGRYAMTAVRLRELAGGDWRLEATDGRVLGIIRGPSAPTTEDEAAAQALPESAALALEALVPAKEMQKAFRAVPKGKGQEDRCLGVMLTRHEVLLVAGESIIPCQPTDGRFPDVDFALPKKPSMFSIRVNAEYMMDLLKVAAAVAKTKDGSASVELLFWSKDLPLGVISQGDDGITFDGLLSPLT